MFKFVDLFAGTGGMRLALEQVCKDIGIETECVFSCEIDKNAAHTYELNFGENPLNDIREVVDLPDFDFMLAGFPCQAFSYAGKHKGFADKRGTLFFEVERLLKLKKPKYFLLENVRGLTTHDKGRTFQTIKDSLQNLGYKIDYALLNSSNFGVPQNRVRIYIVGILGEELKFDIKTDLGAADTHSFRKMESQLPLFDEVLPKKKLVKDILESQVDEKYICSSEYIEKLNKVVKGNFESLHGYRLIDFRGGKSIHSWELGVKGDCSEEEIQFMNLLISNRRKKIFGTHQDGKSLTQEQIETFYKRDDFDEVTTGLLNKGYLSCNDGKYNPVCGNMSFEVFKFLDPNSISITLTASDSNRLGIVQNNIPRRLTPRECARLQGFPDKYILPDKKYIYKQMGNAVSVPVVYSVLKNFLSNNHPQSIAASYEDVFQIA